MKDKIKRHTISFKNAWAGLWWALRSQPNYKIHLLLSTIALLGGLFLSISAAEWLTIAVLIVVGLVVETVNTAIEATTDAISKQWRAELKLAKDVSAGAMLMFATGAFLIAAIIFLPKIFG